MDYRDKIHDLPLLDDGEAFRQWAWSHRIGRARASISMPCGLPKIPWAF